MGEVIRFPDEAGYARGGRYVDANTEPATVIILPVIRIERDPDGQRPRTAYRQQCRPPPPPPRRALNASDWPKIPDARSAAAAVAGAAMAPRSCSRSRHFRAGGCGTPMAISARCARYWSATMSTTGSGWTPSPARQPCPRTFELTDDERKLRDLAYPLIEPPYDRQQWYSVLRRIRRDRLRSPAAIFDRTAYTTALVLPTAYRSPAARYARLIDDIRNDMTRMPAILRDRGAVCSTWTTSGAKGLCLCSRTDRRRAR